MADVFPSYLVWEKNGIEVLNTPKCQDMLHNCITYLDINLLMIPGTQVKTKSKTFRSEKFS